MSALNIHSHEEDFNLLETHLAGTLKRVAPPSDIIQRLRERITLPTREALTLRLHDWKTLFFIFGGVMSGMLLLVTIARALYYFAGRRHPL
ncbi:MAG: hypothetical protein IT310_09395 [Anaerolineales bacterium]|nr:hypothetical protein [Anaerolineales bacterium]